MATKFQRAETIVCDLVVKDSADVLIDPDTSTKIDVVHVPSNTTVVNDQNMVNDSTGKFHFDFQPTATELIGIYRAVFKTVHATRTSIALAEFTLEGSK